MSKNLYLGLDLGTSSVKCVVVDEQGSFVALGQGRYSVQRKGDWAEQDPAEWWRAVKESVQQALQGGLGKSVKGIGVTGQMHGLVALDDDETPVRPAIIWADTRSEKQTQQISTEVENLFSRIGGPVAVGFLLPSLLWVKQYEPHVYARIRRVSTPKDYIRMLLTSKLDIDPTDACGTGAFRAGECRWDVSLLRSLGIDEELFPPISQSLEISGYLQPGPAHELGLSPGIPVVTGCGDAQASAVGIGIAGPDQLLVNMGTGAQVFQLLTVYSPDPNGRYHTMLHADGRHWHTLGAILSGGLAFDWAAAVLGQKPMRFFHEVSQNPACASGLLFLPYLIGERTPYMDSSLSGAFLGLRVTHTARELARAVLEGIVFALYNAYTVTKEVAQPVHSIRAGGGPLRSNTLRQIVADVFGLPLEYSPEPNTSALGAAYLGIIGVTGRDLASIVDQDQRVTGVNEPNPESHQSYLECFQRFKSYTELWLRNR